MICFHKKQLNCLRSADGFNFWFIVVVPSAPVDRAMVSLRSLATGVVATAVVFVGRRVH